MSRLKRETFTSPLTLSLYGKSGRRRVGETETTVILCSALLFSHAPFPPSLPPLAHLQDFSAAAEGIRERLNERVRLRAPHAHR